MTRISRAIRSPYGLPIIVLLMVASLPYWLIQTQFILSVATIALLYMTASLGWNIISGLGGQISFGHSIFFGLAAYVSAVLQSRYGVNAWVSLMTGVIVSVLFAIVFGWVTLRLRGIFFSLSTFAITLTFVLLTAHFEGFTGGHVGLTLPIHGDSVAEFSFENKLVYFYIAMIAAAVGFLVCRLVIESRLGLQLRAVKVDQDAARASGVPATKVKMLGLAISAGLTGLAGGLYLQYIRFIDPDSAFGAALATQIAVIAFVGGSGKLWGPVVGAALLVPLQQILNVELSGFPPGFNLVIYGLVVLVILWIEPRGLLAMRPFGSRDRRAPDGASVDDAESLGGAR